MLKVDLKGKVAFIAGIGDDQGFGWGIAKALAEAGATILVGTWPPILKIFTLSLEGGKFDASRKLSDGSLMQFAKVYPLDASFDKAEDIPEEIKENKRYKEVGSYTIAEVAETVARDYGKIDILVHSIANAPEIKNPLLETSRKGYLSAISASTYSFVSLISHFGPHMNPYSLALSLTYQASEKIIPGYGGGMSSAKAALESDMRTLAWEAGRKWKIRVNTISPGAFGSRAAKAIGKEAGFIEKMIAYTAANAPLADNKLESTDIGYLAAFLACPKLARSITGVNIHADSGLHAMGLAPDSHALET